MIVNDRSDLTSSPSADQRTHRYKPTTHHVHQECSTFRRNKDCEEQYETSASPQRRSGPYTCFHSFAIRPHKMFLALLLSYGPYAVAVFLLFHLVYFRWFHPLAKFPGPFWASQTNAWKAYQLWTRRMPVTLQSLHERYGPVIRIGPNDLNFASEDASATIYKSGRTMPKSSFYDGFTTFQANLFGTRDEDLHALRRRQMSHGFSAASLKSMEGIFDRHISELRKQIEEYAVSGEQFDLKELIAYYAYDIIGELAFSRDFGTLRSRDPADLPPINDHIFLGCMYGMLPNLLPYSMRLTKYIPLPYVQKMLKSRLRLRNTTAECVAVEMARSKDPQQNTEKNLLTQLIDAKDPESGAGLTHTDVASEAFGFLVAGSHTTSGTLTLLFYHLLHSPKVAAHLTKELDDQLELLDEGSSYIYQNLDSTLPYAHACIQENYRITPVFTMPLPRMVTGTSAHSF